MQLRVCRSLNPMPFKHFLMTDIVFVMCMQDPAVYIDSDMPKGKFDKDKYRAYTKSGEEYAFLVWPPLFLHKEGPMLGKGIAQGSK